MEVKEAIDFIPYDEIGQDFVITQDGAISFAFECRLVEAYTMASVVDDTEGKIEPTDSVLFYHSWKLALAQLPDGAVVQKYNFIYTIPYESERSTNISMTKKWNEDLYTKRDIVMDKIYIVVTFPLKNTVRPKRPNSSLLSRVNKYKEDIHSIQEYRDRFLDFSKALRTGNTIEFYNQLSGESILDLCVYTWNQDLKSDDIFRDLENYKGGIAVGEKYLTILSSRKKTNFLDAFSSSNRGLIPTVDIGNNTRYNKDANLPVSYLFPLGIGCPVNHTLIETIELCNKEEVEIKLTKEHNGLNPLASFKDRDAINHQHAINEFKELRSANGYRYAKWGVTVIVEGITEEQSKVYAKKIREVAMTNLGLSLEIENFGAWKAFYNNLPGLGKRLDNLRLDFLETISYLTHVESFKRGNSDGVILVDLFGKPFKQTFWYSKYVTAVNGVIFGPTGQGKSVAVNSILDQCYWDGDVIFLIDVGGSYKRVTAVNNGKYIDSSPLASLAFNPFLDCYSKDGKYYPELDLKGEQDAIYLDFLIALITSCWYGESEIPHKELSTVLRMIIKAYFQSFNKGEIQELKFTTFYQFALSFEIGDKFQQYIDMSSFELVMEKFSDGGDYGYLLNAKETLDINNRWVAFDLKGILSAPEILAPVTLIVMQLFQRKLIEQAGKRIRFWIDEAIDFLKSPSMSNYIGSAYRKIRKEGGQIVIITQSIDYLNMLPELTKSEILSNSDIKILLNHAGKEGLLFDAIQKGLGFSNDEMELLRHQTPENPNKYRIMLVKYGTQKAYLARMEISKRTFALYQTNKEDMLLIDELIERYGGNIPVAVEEFVQLKNANDE